MKNVIKQINSLISELKKIWEDVQSDQDFDKGHERMNRWKERACNIIGDILSPEEGKRFQEKRLTVFSMGDRMGNFKDEYELYHSHLSVLAEEIKNNSEFYLGKQKILGAKKKITTRSPLLSVEKICNRFHSVVRQLQDRHENRSTLTIEDEYDIQDLLHALLKIEFDDIRPEEWTQSYAGKSSRVDFLLKNEKVVVEVKKTRLGLTEKTIGDQLIVDIERYKNHTDCKTLVCFIYDPEGRIGNPNGLISDLEVKEIDSLKVRVIIEPK